MDEQDLVIYKDMCVYVHLWQQQIRSGWQRQRQLRRESFRRAGPPLVGSPQAQVSHFFLLTLPTRTSGGGTACDHITA